MHEHDEELRRILEEHPFEAPLLGAWIYGSRALGTYSTASDIDVLAICRDRVLPRHLSIRLGGMPEVVVSLNVVGAPSLGTAGQYENGGFFFTGKLLSPRYLLLGRMAECTDLLSRAIAAMIDPWAVEVLPKSLAEMTLSPEQCMALLTLLKIEIDFCYLRHFAGWQLSDKFHDYWTESTDMVLQALRVRAGHDEQSAGRLGVGRSRYDPDPHIRRLNRQRLVASFWQFNYHLRGTENDFLEPYFLRQATAIRKLPVSALDESLAFLRRKAYEGA